MGPMGMGGSNPRMDALQGMLGGMPSDPSGGAEMAPPAEGGDPISDVMAHIEEVMAMVPPEQQASLGQALEILRGSTAPGQEDVPLTGDDAAMGEVPAL